MDITPEQWLNQWGVVGKSGGASTSTIISRFAGDVCEFTTLSIGLSQRMFKRNFDRGGFFGTAWAPRDSKWGRKFHHPILVDSGNLQYNIKSKKIDRASNDHPYIFLGEIETGEVSVPARGKRGKRNGIYKNYAALHNCPEKVNAFVNKAEEMKGNAGRRPEKRQFIGQHSSLDSLIERLYIPLIFKHLPK